MTGHGAQADESSTPHGNSRGAIIPGSGSGDGVGVPSFTLTVPAPAALPVLIAVPHAGRFYPPELSAQMRRPAASCLRLEDRLVDLVGRAVAAETGAALLVAHAPRAMIDLNRAPGDIDWEMVNGGPNCANAGSARTRPALGSRARGGLGLVPRRLPGIGELWQRRLGAQELEARLAQVHRPYHAALAGGLQQLHDRWGAALLVDLHSMPPLGPKTGADAAPDFVIGDRFGAACGADLVAAALEQLGRAGHRVAHNRPYAGSYVLDRHGAPARSIHALQVEVCRTAYLDSALAEPGPGLPGVVATLTALVRRLAAELSSRHSARLAAE